MEPEEFEFKLTVDDYNLIMQNLMELPWIKVNPVIHKLNAQMKAHQEEKPAE